MDDTNNHHLLLVRRVLEGHRALPRPTSPLVYRRADDRPPGGRRLLRWERGAGPPVPGRVRLRTRPEDQQESLQPPHPRHRARTLAGSLLGASRSVQAAQRSRNLRGGLPARVRLRQHTHSPLPTLSPARARRNVSRLHREQAALLLRFAGASGGHPSGRAGGVLFGGGFGSGRERVLKDLELDLPEGSIICADKAYTDYDYEDLLEEVGLHLKAQRKKNSKRPMPTWEEFFLSKPIRQYIETVFGGLSGLFSRKIHAVTPRGFELKIVWFLLAFSIQCL